MNLIEQRKSSGGSLADLRTYLQIIQQLLSAHSGDLNQSVYIESISKASPDVAGLIQLLDHLQLLSHAKIQKIVSRIDSDQGYMVKTSHPDLVKKSLDDVYQVSDQDSVGVQVSKGGNIYKRNFETDVNKILM